MRPSAQANPPAANTRKGLSREEMKGLCDRILGFATADFTRVNVESGVRGFTRTAMNRVTTAANTNDVAVRITSVFGKRIASIQTNSLDNASLERAVKDAEALARLSPENPEYLPEPEPQAYSEVNGYYSSTGDLTTEDRARSASLVLERSKSANTIAAGFIDVFAGSDAVANSRGLFAYHASTGVASTLTVRTPDGSSSGWAGDEGADWATIESERIATDALTKCQNWRGKTALDAGLYEVILEPSAVGMLVSRMAGSFDARAADEGRSYFSKRGGGTLLGEKVFDDRVTIASDPAFKNGEAAPFTGVGEPMRAETWVENGVLKTLAYSRFWASRKNTAAKPSMANFVMSGGTASLEEMIASVKRGVLITRFWYIRPINPRLMSQTGLTRDGTFLIENGKVARPVTNFRFNQSIADLLKNVEMLGVPTRVAAEEDGSAGMPVIVPALKVRDFNLASVSDAI
ncbi:MAG TPA: TldD/PmbA family protein [Vicinamibacterales bacterium]|jgi:predicted Zn-dependent protease|nr:TldD/PmbA family protein [Vicinamibacterales bacterium]